MKNRILALVLVIALVGVGIAGATMAYLTDTDSAVNVATVGGVKIEQHEYERVVDANGEFVLGVEGTDFTANYGITQSYKLQPFTQGKPAFPAVYDDGKVDTESWGDFQQLWNQVGAPGSNDLFNPSMKNVIDKFVFVENTGISAAYYRTVIAVECPAGVGEDAIHVNLNANSRFDYDVDVDGVQTAEDANTFFTTIDGVRYYVYVATYTEKLMPGEVSRPSLLQVFLDPTVTGEQIALFGETWDILCFTQAVQTLGFSGPEKALNAAFGAITETEHPWVGGVRMPVLVNTVEELQAALDNAVDGDTIVLNADITGDVVVSQKPNTKITLDGNGKTYAGVILVDGKSATYTSAGLTIKNVRFEATAISADACIQLGNGTNATRYTCNVTVDNCVFAVPGAVGVKSYTGGDKNLTIVNCLAAAGTHSLVQAKGVDGVVVKDCEVYSKNGLNFNNSDNVTVVGCEVDVTGYAVRFGESSGGTGAAETYLIKDCTLKSACDDGDAVIILRGTADYATLTIENTTVTGTLEITNTATGATVVTK